MWCQQTFPTGYVEEGGADEIWLIQVETDLASQCSPSILAVNHFFEIFCADATLHSLKTHKSKQNGYSHVQIKMVLGEQLF